MILFKDNRSSLPINQRLDIAAIYKTPLGSASVKIDADWILSPVIPHEHVKPDGIFPREVVEYPAILELYISELAKERNMTGELWLSVFVDNVSEMDARYKKYRNAHNPISTT